MAKINAVFCMTLAIRSRLKESRPDPPVRREFLFCPLRFISVIEDKLPEVVITVQIELGEFNRQAAWFGTDDFPICLDKQFVFERRKHNAYSAQNARSREYFI